MTQIKYYGSTTGAIKYSRDDLYSQAINEDHSYRPTFKFFGNPDYRHFGIEMEMQTNENDRRRAAVELLTTTNRDERHFYCKRDGSVNNGFEFNSMPMTLNYMKELTDLQDAFMRAEVFTTQVCGFHVHVERLRDEWGRNYYNRLYASLANLNDFVMHISRRKNENSTTRFSRTILDFEDSLISSYNDDAYKRLAKIMRGNTKSLAYSGRIGPRHVVPADVNLLEDMLEENRYTAINLTNDKTIEFRFFEGTVDWDEALMRVEFVHWFMTFVDNYNYIAGLKEFISYLPDGAFRDWVLKEEQEMLHHLKHIYIADRMGLVIKVGDNDVLPRTCLRVPSNKVRKGDYMCSIMTPAMVEHSIGNVLVIRQITDINYDEGWLTGASLAQNFMTRNESVQRTFYMNNPELNNFLFLRSCGVNTLEYRNERRELVDVLKGIIRSMPKRLMDLITIEATSNNISVYIDGNRWNCYYDEVVVDRPNNVFARMVKEKMKEMGITERPSQPRVHTTGYVRVNNYFDQDTSVYRVDGGVHPDIPTANWGSMNTGVELVHDSNEPRVEPVQVSSGLTLHPVSGVVMPSGMWEDLMDFNERMTVDYSEALARMASARMESAIMASVSDDDLDSIYNSIGYYHTSGQQR